jgi:hypothetical protein
MRFQHSNQSNGGVIPSRSRIANTTWVPRESLKVYVAFHRFWLVTSRFPSDFAPVRTGSQVTSPPMMMELPKLAEDTRDTMQVLVLTADSAEAAS